MTPLPLDPFVFILGLIFGSFFNVLIYRLPLDLNPWRGRSVCPQCTKSIPWQHNVPVLSFIWLRGRTACCNKAISWQYPIVELATAIIFWGLFVIYGPTLSWATYTVLGSYLLILSVIDLHHHIIPDELSLTGIPLGVGACLLTHDIHWQASLGGIVLGGGIFFSIAWIYERLTKREGLGGGDVKLLAMLGAWLGAQSILPIIVISTFVGSLVGIGLMATGKANSKAAIPFGPFLSGAAVLYLLFREQLLPFFYPVFFPL